MLSTVIMWAAVIAIVMVPVALVGLKWRRQRILNGAPKGIPLYKVTDQEYLKAHGLNRQERRRLKKSIGAKKYALLERQRKYAEMRELLQREGRTK